MYKVAIFSTSILGTGGSEITIRHLMKKLIHHYSNRVSLTIVIPESEKEFTCDGVSVITYSDKLLKCRTILKAFSHMKEKKEICKILEKFDAVHFFMFQSIIQVFPFLHHSNSIVTFQGGGLQNPRKTDYLSIVRKSPYPLSYKGFRTRFINEITLRLFFRLYRKRLKFTVISSDLLAELKELGVDENRIALIYNGIDRDSFDKVFRSTKPKETNYYKILCVGRNDSRKGLYFMIDAAKSLVQRGIRTFRIIMKGCGFDEIERIVKENNLSEYFHFFSDGERDYFELQTNEEVNSFPDVETIALYKISDIVVIPSLMEGLSNVGAEAVYSHKPIVVSDTFGCREYDKICKVCLSKPGDGSSIADCIEEIINNYDSYNEYAEDNFEKVKLFDFDHIVDSYYEFYKKVI